MRFSRRQALRSAVVASAAAGAAALGVAGHTLLSHDPALTSPRGAAGLRHRPTAGFIRRENEERGSAAWKLGDRGTLPASDKSMRVKGFASATTVEPGESLSFFVTVARSEAYTIDIYRMGWYGGVGARHLTSSGALRGRRQRPHDIDPVTGLITCPWEPSWVLEIPAEWTPGAHIAVFTTSSGWRTYTPFVVHDPSRTGGLCVVLPFTTYQAYNQWPFNGRDGKSLYYGFGPADSLAPTTQGTPSGDATPAPSTSQSATAWVRDAKFRAHRVSFDRPYMGAGLPQRFDQDHYFIQWVEQQGYDLNYATSIDLESGRVDPGKHAGMIFSGHDEYWSQSMRSRITAAHTSGTHLAFMGANNVYWHIRFAASPQGVPNRVVVCHKDTTDPLYSEGGITGRWRDSYPSPADPEQRLLGVQYNGIVKEPAPLLVRRADHWLWAGTGVQDGTAITGIVGGEADGFDPAEPSPDGGEQVLLSASPYVVRYGESLVQNTGLHTRDNGAMVFAAGTLNWTSGLAAPEIQDARIRRLTQNLLALGV